MSSARPSETPPASPEIGSLANRVASGTFWLAGVSMATRVVGFAAQWILLILLQPAQVGVFALVQTITMFAHHLTFPGIDEVLVQKGAKIGRWISSAFWLSLACGVGGAALMVLLGLAVVTIARAAGNDAYGNPDLLKMIAIYALGAPLNALATVPMCLLKNQMRFGRIAGIVLFEVVAQQSLTVALAALGFGPYSFVLPMPIVALARTAVLWVMVRPRISARPGLHRWPMLVASTRFVLGARLTSTSIHHGDQIVLGVKLANETINGYYQSAVLLTQQVVRLLCENLLHVLVPVLNSFHGDRDRLEGAVRRAARGLAVMIIPLAGMQIMLIDPLVRALFPARWLPTIELVQCLSFAPLMFASAYPMMAMLRATGQFRKEFYLVMVNAVIFYALVIPGTAIGQQLGTAAGVVIAYWIMAHVYAWAAFGSARGIGVIYRSIAAPTACTLVAAAAALSADQVLPGGPRWAELFRALAMGVVMASVYLLMLRLLDPASLRQLSARLAGAGGSVARRLRRHPPAGES